MSFLNKQPNIKLTKLVISFKNVPGGECYGKLFLARGMKEAGPPCFTRCFKEQKFAE
jgi:hypothetical protein